MEALPSRAKTASRLSSSLATHWSNAAPYQKFAYLVSALMMFSGLFHLFALFFSGDSWAGDVSFRKAITFGFSFGLTLATLAWFFSFLPKNRILAWLTLSALSVASLYEVFAVTLQRWRGVASHFNTATPFDAAIFSLMGTAVSIIGLVIVVITLWSFFPSSASPSLAWSIRLSLLLLIAAQFFGVQIIIHATTQLENNTGLALTIFGNAGVMKLPHFFAMHAIQVLPVLALLDSKAGASKTSLHLIFIAALGYSSLLGVTAIQMYSGLAPFALSSLSWLLLLTGLGLIGFVGLNALSNFTPHKKSDIHALD